MTEVNTAPPVITGTEREGSTLHVSDGTWTYSGDRLEFDYQWKRCDALGASCVNIAGATNPNYTLQNADVGHTIKADVTATEVTDPTPPPPSTPELRWAPPTLSSPTVKALTNSARSVAKGSGQDLRITALTQDLTGSIGQIEGYGDVEMIAGKILSGEANEGHIIPRELTGTFHIEGWDIKLTGPADAITVRWRVPILQIENCRIEVTTAGTTHHSDAYQTQEQITNDLRIDRCTIITNYQGIFLSNEPQNAGPARSKVAHQTISRVLFKPNGGFPATFFFKAFPPRPNTDPIGPTELYDCWMPAANAGTKVYPQSNFSSWAGGTQKYGCFVTTKVHPVLGPWPFLKFSTGVETIPVGTYAGQTAADCQINGDGGFWLYTDLADVPDDVGCDSDVGRAYTSPGYL